MKRPHLAGPFAKVSPSADLLGPGELPSDAEESHLENSKAKLPPATGRLNLWARFLPATAQQQAETFTQVQAEAPNLGTSGVPKSMA